jgi:hypothetical protein
MTKQTQIERRFISVPMGSDVYRIYDDDGLVATVVGEGNLQQIMRGLTT